MKIRAHRLAIHPYVSPAGSLLCAVYPGEAHYEGQDLKSLPDPRFEVHTMYDGSKGVDWNAQDTYLVLELKSSNQFVIKGVIPKTAKVPIF